MRVSLGVPFHSTEPTRIAAFDKAMEELKGLTQWHRIQVHGFWVKPFNRGKARNELVDILAPDSDVIVLCDGDSYPQREPLMRAILGAAFDGKIHIPFDTVQPLGPQGEKLKPYGPSFGGCYVTAPWAWKAIGGQEERGSWSTDDRTLLVKANTLLGGPVYHQGILTCLHHARGPETRVSAESTRIINEYLALEGKPDELREYIERHRA